MIVVKIPWSATNLMGSFLSHFLLFRNVLLVGGLFHITFSSLCLILHTNQPIHGWKHTLIVRGNTASCYSSWLDKYFSHINTEHWPQNALKRLKSASQCSSILYLFIFNHVHSQPVEIDWSSLCCELKIFSHNRYYTLSCWHPTSYNWNWQHQLKKVIQYFVDIFFHSLKKVCCKWLF